MFQKFTNDIQASLAAVMRRTSLVIAIGFFLFVMTAFLCAAAFVFVLQTYGLLQACLAGAGVFFVAAVLAGIAYAVAARDIPKKKSAEPAAKSTMQTALSDPMVVAAGLQIIRTIGLKRIIPLAAIAGIAVGVLASRRQLAETEPTQD